MKKKTGRERETEMREKIWQLKQVAWTESFANPRGNFLSYPLHPPSAAAEPLSEEGCLCNFAA